MLSHDFPFDIMQMPLNCLDATFRSFETKVVLELNRRGIDLNLRRVPLIVDGPLFARIDDKHFDRDFARFQFEPKLLFDGFEY